MAEQVDGLSSMATKQLLSDLGDVLWRRCSVAVHFDSAGGVDVARTIRAGAQADLAVLSGDAMADLAAEGVWEAGTLRPLFVSEVVAATADNVPAAPLSTEDDLRAALVGATRIAYSTGPSGDGLVELIKRWELLDLVGPKLVQVGSGTPVGSVLADGAADLGFQQRSELSGVRGVRVLGPLPGSAAIRSTFSGAVLARSTNKGSALDVLRFLTSEAAEEHVLLAGMALA